MNIGERIKKIRTEKNISVDYIATELGVSKTTIYRYEDSSIEKIPVNTFNKICSILGVTPAELIGNKPIVSNNPSLPASFNDAHKAMEFLLKMPVFASYGGYNIDNMSDDTITDFANEILKQLQLVSYKYKGANYDVETRTSNRDN